LKRWLNKSKSTSERLAFGHWVRNLKDNYRGFESGLPYGIHVCIPKILILEYLIGLGMENVRTMFRRILMYFNGHLMANTQVCFVVILHFLVCFNKKNLATQVCINQIDMYACRKYSMLSRVARWFVLKPKIPIWINLGGSFNGKSWYILWPVGLFYGHWKYFMAIWYSLWSFGIFLHVLVFCTKKNLATLMLRRVHLNIDRICLYIHR
jgi:hypothetical protein